MAAPQLALPAAGRTGTNVEGRRAALPLAVLVAGAGVAMLVAGLVASYLALRARVDPFPPEGMQYDNYTATTLVVTVVMAMVTIEWAAYGIRKGFRGQALFGFGVTVLLAGAFLNGLHYLITQLGFEAGDTAYAGVVYAMLAIAFGLGILGLLAVLLTGLRAAGHQLTTDNYQVMRATALLWHVVALAWLAVYYTIYVTK